MYGRKTSTYEVKFTCKTISDLWWCVYSYFTVNWQTLLLYVEILRFPSCPFIYSVVHKSEGMSNQRYIRPVKVIAGCWYFIGGFLTDVFFSVFFSLVKFVLSYRSWFIIINTALQSKIQSLLIAMKPFPVSYIHYFCYLNIFPHTVCSPVKFSSVLCLFFVCYFVYCCVVKLWQLDFLELHSQFQVYILSWKPVKVHTFELQLSSFQALYHGELRFHSFCMISVTDC